MVTLDSVEQVDTVSSHLVTCAPHTHEALLHDRRMKQLAVQ